jgi:hypothetical protein
MGRPVFAVIEVAILEPPLQMFLLGYSIHSLRRLPLRSTLPPQQRETLQPRSPDRTYAHHNLRHPREPPSARVGKLAGGLGRGGGKRRLDLFRRWEMMGLAWRGLLTECSTEEFEKSRRPWTQREQLAGRRRLVG